MTWPFIRTLVRHDVLDSTSRLARELAERGEVILPFAVLADRQTKGRGRGDHTWWSDAGSLTVTIVVDPAELGLGVEHEPCLALATAVALIESLPPTLSGGVAGIRWPNDVEVGGKKLGGILPERVETLLGRRLAIGIGLNVTTRLAAAPTEIRLMATSLADLVPEPPTPDALLRSILERFESVVELLARDDAGLAARWQALDTLRGQSVRVDVGPRVVSGEGAGIDDRGALLLRDGPKTHRLFGGQVLRNV
jgi:BirA family biotin operon repressor/biotin-[acetyl-CoA-carboxylase] ligase